MSQIPPKNFQPSVMSTYKFWIKNISFCNLKYEDHKNEDCSLTYPNLKEKRKQVDMVSGLPAI